MKHLFIFISLCSLTLQTLAQSGLQTSVIKLKEEIEKDTIESYEGGRFKYNASVIKFDYDPIQKEVIISRIKIPEQNYSDPTNDREIRRVKVDKLDPGAIRIDSSAYGFTFKIMTLSREKEVEFRLLREGKEEVIMNNFINLGMYKQPDAGSYLRNIERLFRSFLESA